MKAYLHILIFSVLLAFITPLSAQPDGSMKNNPRYDLSSTPVLYTVGYAHLDTQWRWDYEETINVFLKNTLDDNFLRFEKYKPYVFTFSGARRYKMMKEYYPVKFEKLKKYITQGRWFVGGSSVDECDANIPSPESIIRQVLYGNAYFQSEFGKESVDFLLPDCFGFQAHLPSALAHAGIKGFSTQKLEWGSAAGIPFNIGNWNGPDGKGVVAALNATDYSGKIEPRLDTVKYWVDRVMANGKKYKVFADYRYYGVGDVGGAPREEDIKNAVGSLEKADGRINVYLSSSDQLFRDLNEEQKSRLPGYSGDLLLTEHSAGSLTSEAYMKRWNRKNEQLAMAVEPLAAMAQWLGGAEYPQTRINQAWWLVMGSQMHDILPGTSIPKAYEYAWNDEILAMNQFAYTMENSAGTLARAMDTRNEGKCILVYNPLAIARKDLVEAEIRYPEGVPESIKVMDPDHKEIPVQVLSRNKSSVRILFLADMPSLGLACYSVEINEKPGNYQTSLSSGGKFLENEFYKIIVNDNGDMASILDKKTGKAILSAPARLEFLKEHPVYWPAWNMDWSDRQKPPVDFVKGPARITLEENGPVRACLRIERNARNSVFVQYICLTAGKEQIIVRNNVDWQSRGVSLKASFPLTVSNSMATYNLGLGTIERGTNEEKKYEVPSREWFDLTDKSGNYGVTILEDCKFGSDKPNDKTLRLTLLYTPSANFYHDQATQDWGRHDFTYGLYAHKGDWRTGLSEWQGRSLNQPLRAFVVSDHPGFLGKRFSFAHVSTPAVDIRTLKKAEKGERVILRLQELLGKDAQNTEISFSSRILDAYEVDGQERRISDALLANGKLIVNMEKFAVRSFSVRLEAPAEKLDLPVSIPLTLPFDQDVVSNDRNKKNGRFAPTGISIPAEQFPESLSVDGIQFNLGKTEDGQNNALICKGQKISLPKTGNFNRLYILAAATNDTSALFRVGSVKTNFRIQGFTGKIGQSDKRIWDKLDRIKALEKAFIKRDEVAWYATHVHRDTSNVAYQYAYIFKYALDVSPASGFLQLPEDESIRIFAITLADNNSDQEKPAAALFDDFSGRSPMKLDLPSSFVSESMDPAAKYTLTRKKKLTDLPARVTMRDYADMHMPNGVAARYYFSNADSNFRKLENGMFISSVNDGMFDLLPNDSLNDIWSETGEGRIFMDLAKEIEIDSIHLFATLDTKRGACSFSLWAASGMKSPDVKGDPKLSGWTYLLTATQPDIWGNSNAVYSILPFRERNKAYRYLLWISEDSPHGPHYFREVDIFEKQK